MKGYRQHINKHIADAAGGRTKEESGDDRGSGTEESEDGSGPTIEEGVSSTQGRKRGQKRTKPRSQDRRRGKRVKQKKAQTHLLSGGLPVGVSNVPQTSGENSPDPTHFSQADISKFRMEGALSAMRMFGPQDHNAANQQTFSGPQDHNAANQQTFVPGVFFPPRDMQWSQGPRPTGPWW
jgi:hypothetical protein